MLRVITIVLTVSAFSLLNVAGVSASAVRVAVRSNVSVTGDVILLSHLLEELAPRTLLDSASKISLGSAPQLGTVRHIRRNAIASALAQTGMDNFDFEIPEEVVVHQSGRTISKQEMAAAVQSYLLAENPHSDIRIASSGLTASDTFLVPEGDLDLYVKASNYDAALHRGFFSLASGKYPQMKSFQVNADQYGPVSRASGRQSQEKKQTLEPILVRPGVPARLIVRAADTRMILSVLPTKQGHDGEIIRVRLPKTTTYLKAKVVAENSLEASY